MAVCSASTGFTMCSVDFERFILIQCHLSFPIYTEPMTADVAVAGTESTDGIANSGGAGDGGERAETALDEADTAHSEFDGMMYSEAHSFEIRTAEV